MKKFDKIYFALTFTWGLLANLIGAIVALVFKLFLKPEITTKYGRWVFVSKGNWGGLSLGNFVFMSEANAKGTHTIRHEIGHSLQNVLWGPLFLFVIGLPSITRCWYRETPLYTKHPEKHTDYDSIWFEGQATAWGTKYVEACEKVA
jgi:hypothetical protein